MRRRCANKRAIFFTGADFAKALPIRPLRILLLRPEVSLEMRDPRSRYVLPPRSSLVHIDVSESCVYHELWRFTTLFAIGAPRARGTDSGAVRWGAVLQWVIERG
jgi:hypothetical protein